MDAGTVDGGRRDADVAGAASPLPSPDPPRQPALRELLARRLRDPRHRGHEQPRFVSGLDWTPPFAHPTHTTLPIPFPLHGRRVMLVSDEDVAKLAPSAAVVPLARRHHRRDASCAVRELPGRRGRRHPAAAVHRLSPAVRGGARHRDPRGLVRPRAPRVDIADPHAPREVASFVPPVPDGATRVVQQRRLSRRARAPLPDRPRPRRAHPRARVVGAESARRVPRARARDEMQLPVAIRAVDE